MKRIKIYEHLDGQPSISEFGIEEQYNQTTPEFKELYDQKGVYYIYDSETAKNPIYIGRSKSNLGKTILHHFQKWATVKERKYQEQRKEKLKNFYVEVFLMPEADELEIFAKEGDEIEKHEPPMNKNKLLRKWKENLNHYKKKVIDLEAENASLAEQAKAWEEYQNALRDSEILKEQERQALENLQAQQAEQERLYKEAEALEKADRDKRRKKTGFVDYRKDREVPF